MNRRRGFVLLILAIFIALGAYLRFNGLKTRGMAGVDTYQYLEIVRHWARGDLVFNDNPRDEHQYFRPVFYATYWAALKIFGWHDWSMRAMLATLDIGTALFVFTILWRMTGAVATAALSGAAVYALCPVAIAFTRHELVHALSSFWVVLTLWLTLETTLRRFDRRWMIWGGFALGSAACTHGDLAFLGPGFVFTLALARAGSSAGRARWALMVQDAAIFTTSFFAPFVLWGAICGFSRMLSAILSESTIKLVETSPPFLWFLKQLYFVGFTEITSKPTVVINLVLALLAPLAWYRARSSSEKAWVAGLWLTLAVHLIIFSAVLKDVFLSRLLVPLLPIYTIAPIFTVFVLVRDMKPRVLASGLLVGFAATVIHQNYRPSAGLINEFLHPVPEQVRAIHDATWTQVNSENRILVTPYAHSLNHNRRRFNAVVYFKKNAVYLVDCRSGSLDDYVQAKKIRFIALTARRDWDVAEMLAKAPESAGVCVEQTPSSYDPEADIAFVRAYAERNGHLMFTGPQGETVYKLIRSDRR